MRQIDITCEQKMLPAYQKKNLVTINQSATIVTRKGLWPSNEDNLCSHPQR